MYITTNTNTTATFTYATTTTKLLQLLPQLQQLVRLRVLRWKGCQKGIRSTHQQYFWNSLTCQGETSRTSWKQCSTDQKATCRCY